MIELYDIELICVSLYFLGISRVDPKLYLVIAVEIYDLLVLHVHPLTGDPTGDPTVAAGKRRGSKNAVW